MTMFEDGVRGVGADETFQVKDIAELVAAALVAPEVVAPETDSARPRWSAHGPRMRKLNWRGERAMGFEPTTFCLGSRHSAN